MVAEVFAKHTFLPYRSIACPCFKLKRGFACHTDEETAERGFVEEAETAHPAPSRKVCTGCESVLRVSVPTPPDAR